jgi:hypothetical protein
VTSYFGGVIVAWSTFGLLTEALDADPERDPRVGTQVGTARPNVANLASLTGSVEPIWL